jgi:hypothetical protein
MITRQAFAWRPIGALTFLFGGLALAATVFPVAVRSQNKQDMPGALSAAHVPKPGETDCSACHASPGKTAPGKCLVCHAEIASRIAAGRGFHRDKGEDCAVCHAEHQGRQASIVPLDRADFDHSETGAELKGAHLRTKDCDKCHTPANTLPRAKGRSFLLKEPGCRGCHAPPHPGDQDKCAACHGQESWVVDRHGEEG